MAFDRSNLTAIAHGNGFTLWHYKTTDAAAVVDTAGYFNEAADQLRVGDRIHASVDTDGTPGYGDFAVLSNSGGVVDVGDMLNAAAADTD